MTRHFHVFSAAAPGLDQCTDCDVTRANPHTADHGHLPECPCGRGWGLWLDGDRTPQALCSGCFSAHLDRQEAA